MSNSLLFHAKNALEIQSVRKWIFTDDIIKLGYNILCQYTVQSVLYGKRESQDFLRLYDIYKLIPIFLFQKKILNLTKNYRTKKEILRIIIISHLDVLWVDDLLIH